MAIGPAAHCNCCSARSLVDKFPLEVPELEYVGVFLQAPTRYPSRRAIIRIGRATRWRMESLMKPGARTAIALFGGAAVLVLAVGCGGGKSPSTTTTTTPSSSVTPVSPPSATPGGPAPSGPSTTGNVPSAPGGCIPHMNC